MNLVSIHQRKVTERPRERMQLYGPLSLSDQELLAILLGSGSSTVPVMELAQQLLGHATSLSKLTQQTFDELCTIKGIGPAKATLILAASELGRRMQQPQALPIRIDSEVAAIKHFKRHFSPQQDPSYLLVLLNRQRELLATSELQYDETLQPDLSKIIRIVNDACAHIVSA
ncbi:MAG: hypothetical protein JKY70_05100 [Mucilaginibacter sp.]|nr:hypothetical protein [Mucilaginibacter sp.]